MEVEWKVVPITKEEVIDILSKVPPEQYRDKFMDAWSIFKPEAFTNMGFSEDWVSQFVRKHKSDGTYKGNITVNGKVVKHLVGIESRDVAFRIADVLGLEEAVDEALDKYGRGSQLETLAYPIWRAVNK
tara:strand:- start:2078 stop:2464 length:387 start_codon:yes stop_codon:yes gene_type:complete